MTAYTELYWMCCWWCQLAQVRISIQIRSVTQIYIYWNDSNDSYFSKYCSHICKMLLIIPVRVTTRSEFRWTAPKMHLKSCFTKLVWDVPQSAQQTLYLWNLLTKNLSCHIDVTLYHYLHAGNCWKKESDVVISELLF